uniref:Uncharacterized protein n=1 Tax=Scleropages formosus TaxID=113540 RepID=A0A8C9RS52_SCLFO
MDETRYSEPGNTSDEDQEDLPYDGDLVVTDTDLTTDQQNCVNEKQNLVPQDKTSNESMDHGHNEETGPVDNRTDNKASHSDITNLLLRHLSQEELFSSSKYIEAETLPEVSFIDSVEETVLTKLPHKLSQMGNPEILQSEHLENYESQRNECEPESEMVEVCGEQPEVRYRSRSPKLIDGNMQIPRARPYHELKYGQGQVHYPLPDFSKVLPKVKIPKGSDTGRPDSKLPSAQQGQPSPGFLRKSSKATIEVISQVLEDSIQLPEMAHMCSNQKKFHRDPSKSPEIVQHLQPHTIILPPPSFTLQMRFCCWYAVFFPYILL